MNFENFDKRITSLVCLILQFLGKWFIIQGSKTGDDVKAESCVILNFTHLDQDTYLSTQLPQNWTTKLRFNGDKNQSHLLIKLDETNETPFHIVATDYGMCTVLNLSVFCLHFEIEWNYLSLSFDPKKIMGASLSVNQRLVKRCEERPQFYRVNPNWRKIIIS